VTALYVCCVFVTGVSVSVETSTRCQARTLGEYFKAGIGITLGFIAVGVVFKMLGLEGVEAGAVAEHPTVATSSKVASGLAFSQCQHMSLDEY
jgi:hypothetical protein